MNRDEYRTITKYRGANGQIVHVEPMGLSARCKWSIRFAESGIQFTGFKSKFDALVFAAHKCGKAGAEMNWEPAA